MPPLTDSVAALIEELRRECSRTNTRCVRLDDTENLRNRGWRDTRTNGGSTRNRMATCHKWVRPTIEIEHRGLRTFKQDLTASIHQVMGQSLRVADIRSKCGGYCAELLDDGIHGVCLALEDVLQDGILQRDDLFQALAKAGWIDDVAHPDTDAACFVCIAWPDATTRCADFGFATGGFLMHIEVAVIRKDYVRILGNTQPRDINALCNKRIYLFRKSPWIDNHSIRHDGNDSRC